MIGRRITSGPKTDVQNRIKVIEDQCREIQAMADVKDDAALALLAHAVDYLAKIVRKHLHDGET